MSTAAQRRALLMPHDERQALIRQPLPFDPRRTVTLFNEDSHPPQKRWGGVQIINDEDWMRDANAWRKRYTQDSDNETEAIL